MIYVLGPYRSIDDTYTGPPGWVNGIDLAPIEVQGKAAGSRPVGVFACESNPGDDWTVLGEGDPREIHTTARMRQAFRTGTGYMPQGDTLADLIWDCLTDGADPAGEAACKPLMPTRKRELELWFGPRVRQEAFAVGKHGHSNRVLDVIRRDFRRQWEEDQTHARKVLDFECHKYRLDDWQQFVPSDLRAHVPGRLKHETTISDNFNRADNDNISTSAPFSWTEVEGAWAIAGNVLSRSSNSGAGFARAQSDLSGSDHYSQVDAVTLTASANEKSIGPACRYSSSANTAYYFDLSESGGTKQHNFGIVNAGSRSAARLPISFNFSLPHTLRIEANGSTISYFRDATSVASLTNTTITGNTRCGVWSFNNSAAGQAQCDNFTASDLGGGGGGNRRRRVILGASA